MSIPQLNQDRILFALKSTPPPSRSAAEKEKNKEAEYQRILKQLDESRETEEQRMQRKAEQNKQAQIRAAKKRKESTIRGRIAWLRSRIMANPMDKAARAEMDMAKTQLYWLNNSISYSGD